VGCASGAIEEGDTQCHINVALCIECGICEQNCPSGAIIFVEMEELDQHQDAEGTKSAMAPG
jgi:Fe-S-cluster-containing hydrogenase component 2